MKKVFFALMTIVCIGTHVNAQDIDFGFTAGYVNADASLKVNGTSADIEAVGGFYGGFVIDVSIANKFGIRPELLYLNVDGSDAIFLPVLAKIGLVKGLHLQAGPQFGLSLESIPDEFTAFELDAAAGLGLDLPLGLFFEARYAFQLNNGFTGSQDVTARSNYITVGAGFKF